MACCNSWGRKESDTTERLNSTELIIYLKYFSCSFLWDSTVIKSFLKFYCQASYCRIGKWMEVSIQKPPTGAKPVHLPRIFFISSDQIRSVAQSCPTLCNPMNHSTPVLPVHHQLLEFTETHVHRVSDAIQPSHPLSTPFPPAPNPSQHQTLFQ